MYLGSLRKSCDINESLKPSKSRTEDADQEYSINQKNNKDKDGYLRYTVCLMIPLKLAVTNFSLRKGHGRYRDPVTHQMTPALLRVRAPFFYRNVIALVLVSSVPIGAYLYTWRELNKDEFSDIPIPPISDEELSKLKKEYEKNK